MIICPKNMQYLRRKVQSVMILGEIGIAVSKWVCYNQIRGYRKIPARKDALRTSAGKTQETDQGVIV